MHEILTTCVNMAAFFSLSFFLVSFEVCVLSCCVTLMVEV